MTWRPDTSDGRESIKIRWELVEYTRGRGVDLGCGVEKPFPHFIGVDNNIDERLFGYRTTADVIVPTCEKLDMFASGSMDFVFSSHLLEHIVDYKATLREWWRLVKPGGNLILYLPHKEHYPNIGTPGANPDHKHDFMPEDIIEAMKEQRGWDLIRNETRSATVEYSFFQVYRKRAIERKDDHGRLDMEPKPAKTAAVIRYGAYGDVLQAASALPLLKAEGFHVTFYTVPRGYEVIKTDPNVDRFILQDEEQVPNHWLGAWFEWMESQYDRVVNFCNVVEGQLLPDSTRTHFFWPKEARHAVCNMNYVEVMHKVAQVPYERPLTKFHATESERVWARERRARAGEVAIVWSLSGSAAHKVWPHVDTIVARILLSLQDVTITIVGGPDEAPLMAEWAKEKRVQVRCGVWNIRESLAFAQTADLVIGPETGVLNAMAMEPMAKVLLLSHSTVENLCRDWVNTHALAAEHVECYPCHRLHREGFKFCNKHPEGNAACQFELSPEAVWPVVLHILRMKTQRVLPLDPTRKEGRLYA